MVISFCCGKGGTGKTTSTYNIGAALAQAGKRVLLVDNDQQGSLTLSMGYEPQMLSLTLANLMFQAIDMPEQLEQSVEQTIQKTTNNLHLIQANNKLAGTLSRLVSMQNTRAMFPLDDGSIAPERVLSAIVEQVKDQYDYILIDCSPHLDLQMLNALVASNRVIIPTQAHFLDTAGLNDTIEIIRKVQQSLNPNLRQVDILLTMFMSRTVLNQKCAGTLWRANAYLYRANRLLDQSSRTSGCWDQFAGICTEKWCSTGLPCSSRGGHAL